MFSEQSRKCVLEHLKLVYPEHDQAAILSRIESQISKFRERVQSAQGSDSLWSCADTLLITYADSIVGEGEVPLQTLKRFLDTHMVGALKNVHLLPFYPFTSDDGFSVADYVQVNPEVGTWQNVRNLAERFTLMFDLVLNHCSASHPWFKAYLEGQEEYQNYFIESDPKLDHSLVVRPRSLPLLTPFQTKRGERHVWTTFSADQIDLNYATPAVLHEMIDALLVYLEQGAKIVRFDAPTYLWKKLGTTCVSLPETHAVMKVFRAVMETAAPQSVVLTETNVPHAENISYFGDSDEAHMVYNFTLPPLLLHAMRSRNTRYLKKWAKTLSDIPQGCTFLNFTASHDGIGVRGLKDIIPDEEIAALVAKVQELGGKISTRRLSDGSDTPYEMNIVYYDALGDERDDVGATTRERFITTQMIAMAFRGVPAIYIQSLIGGRNDYTGLNATGRARSINRRRWGYNDLLAHLETPNAKQVFDRVSRALRVRSAQPALHPLGEQEVLETNDSLFGLRRRHAGQDFISISNVSENEQVFSSELLHGKKNLFTQEVVKGSVTIAPFCTVWIA
jgi:sucrose phosphorylase